MKPTKFDAFAVELAGRNVVDASAGTGKTYAITTLVVRLLIEHRLRIKDVLVVTFTEAATAELRDRVRRRLREAWQAFYAAEQGHDVAGSDFAAYVDARRSAAQSCRQWLELALEEVDEAPISTIHGFCHRMLSEAALESGLPFDAELTADARPFRDELVYDFYSRDLAAQPLEDARAVVSDANVEQWRALADKVFRTPDARVLPADSEDRQAQWQELRQALASCWRRKDIEMLLLSWSGFCTTLQKTTLARWCDDIEALLEQTSLPHKTSNGLDGLRPAALAERAQGDNWPRHEVFTVLERIWSLIRAEQDGGAAAVVNARRRFALYLRSEAPKLKQASGTITFDDLLLRLRDAVRGPAAAHLVNVVRRQYQAALIDEFQDTDPVQFTIFERLFSRSEVPLFLIGDPKQAIYGFRGADVNAYLSAVNVEGTRHHSMSTNWRSDPGLLRAVNTLFCARQELPAPFVLEGITFTPVSARPTARDVLSTTPELGHAPLDVLLVPSAMPFGDEDVARLVAADIARMVSGGGQIAGEPVRPADVAVLARTNNQARLVQKALRALQVPAVLLGDTSVLDTEDARELTTVLAAIVEPTNAQAMRQALATGLMGQSALELVALEEDAAAWSAWSEAFRQWHQIWVEQGFVQMFRRWFEHEAVEPRLLGYVDGERRVTNLLHLMELVHRAARENHLGPAGVLHWLGQAPRNSEGGVAPDEAQIRLESDEAAVKLTTVHRSKGLEYPIVYCPYVCGDFLLMRNDKTIVKFHDEEGVATLDVGSSQFVAHVEKAAWEAMAENVRLLYVALTRAKHRCTLLWGYRGGIKESAVGWLLYPLSQRELKAGSPFGSLGKLSDAQLREPISAWATRAEGAVALRQAVDAPSPPYVPPRDPRPLHGARQVDRRLQAWRRTTSFSALASGGARTTSHAPAVVDRVGDRDDGAAAGEALAPSSVDDVPLADFPRGAKAGNFFHGLLETIDFQANSSSLAAPVGVQLDLYQYPRMPWQQTVAEALAEILRAPLRPDALEAAPPSLDRLLPTCRRAELEFALPLSTPKAGQELQHALARAFMTDATEQIETAYATRLEQLPMGTIEGFVKGFIDLVFEWNGRYYLADYKTNHLGRRWSDYEAPALGEAMSQGHYFLQSHLYTVALHRHLGRTVAGYRYDQHFGGVFYLFLRGMSGTRPGNGVFFHRPTGARVEALDDVFAHAGPK